MGWENGFWGIVMSVELMYPHIEKPQGQPARLQRVPRVRVAQIVMDYLAYGWSTEEMCRQHPYLTLAEAHAAMGYYYDHLDEIEAEIRAEVEQAEQAGSTGVRSPFFVRLRAKGIL
jgi:uncharacterized protein (DUF433 family)